MALRVGIIGLGKIGRACASNLIADGFTVCALRRAQHGRLRRSWWPPVRRYGRALGGL